jgi:hypothetical protein
MFTADYRKLDIETRKKIYNAYYHIFNDSAVNDILRTKISGILYENDNEVFALKIYHPASVTDTRLLYDPIELTIMGKNKKNSIPYNVTGFENNIPYNVIDENVINSLVIDENVSSDIVLVNYN